jgi:hypothetical protein
MNLTGFFELLKLLEPIDSVLTVCFALIVYYFNNKHHDKKTKKRRAEYFLKYDSNEEITKEKERRKKNSPIEQKKIAIAHNISICNQLLNEYCKLLNIKIGSILYKHFKKYYIDAVQKFTESKLFQYIDENHIAEKKDEDWINYKNEKLKEMLIESKNVGFEHWEKEIFGIDYEVAVKKTMQATIRICSDKIPKAFDLIQKKAIAYKNGIEHLEFLQHKMKYDPFYVWKKEDKKNDN